MEAAERDTALSIGEALGLLQAEFPDISISKIRFLEAKGLIAPERTASGFRRFQPEDIDRLVAILKMQRDQYLPLKVIREQFGAKEESKRAPKRSRADHRSRPDQPRLGIDGEDTALQEHEDLSESTTGLTTQSQRTDTVLLRIVQQESAMDPEDSDARDESKSARASTQTGETASNRSEESVANSEVASVDLIDDGPRTELDPTEGALPTETATDSDTKDSDAPLRDSSVANDALNMLVASESASFAEAGKHWVTPRSKTLEPVSKAAVSESSEPNGVHKAPSGTIRRRSEGIGTEAASALEKSETPEGTRSTKDFAREAGISPSLLGELEQYGIIKSSKHLGEVVYESRYLELVRVARSLGSIGLSPRHLKSLRVSVEKEFGLIEQLVVTQLGAGGPRSKRKARELATALEEQTQKFHATLLAILLEELFIE